jgi:hypothetical protein
MLVNSYSSPRAKGCTGKFQNFVRLGNCSRIDHNKLQGGGPAVLDKNATDPSLGAAMGSGACRMPFAQAAANFEPALVKYGPHPKLAWGHPAIASYTDIVMEGFDFEPVSETTVTNMTCPAMREMLARRGLPVTGNKATLRDRLLTGDPNKSKVYCKVRRKILTAVHNNIDRFGEDGYGEKPVHMDPVDYWLSHLNPAIFNRID